MQLRGALRAPRPGTRPARPRRGTRRVRQDQPARIAADEAAAEGFMSFGARATELERDFAFGLVRQLLEP